MKENELKIEPISTDYNPMIDEIGIEYVAATNEISHALWAKIIIAENRVGSPPIATESKVGVLDYDLRNLYKAMESLEMKKRVVFIVCSVDKAQKINEFISGAGLPSNIEVKVVGIGNEKGIEAFEFKGRETDGIIDDSLNFPSERDFKREILNSPVELDESDFINMGGAAGRGKWKGRRAAERGWRR